LGLDSSVSVIYKQRKKYIRYEDYFDEISVLIIPRYVAYHF